MAFPDYTPTVPAMLRALVQRFGAKPLILLGARRISYAEADAASARLARGLLARGVAKGARVTREDLNILLDGYYEARGWTPAGVPKAEKLKEVGLSEYDKTIAGKA